MTRSILVPVDFTDHSLNAYLYANNLAYRLGLDLRLVHVDPDPAKQGELLQRLKSLSRWHPNEEANKFYPVTTTYAILHGPVTSLLAEASRDDGIELAIAGTRDKHNLKDKWLGTVSQHFSQAAHCPVMLIPAGCRFAPYRQIVVASDFHLDNYFVLDKIRRYFRSFDGETHFLHVQTDDSDSYEYLEDTIEQTIRAYGAQEDNIKMVTRKGRDVVATLFSYASNHTADLLIIISEHRDFWQQIARRSMTRQIVLQSTIPVLVLHEDES